MKFKYTPIIVLFFFSNMAISQSKDTQAIEGVLYSDEGWVSLSTNTGKISGINRLDKEANVSKMYVSPGLIDVQINGFMGVDFSGPDLTVEGIRKATKALWKVGVTTYFPTIITSDFKRMKKNFAILAQAQKDPEIGASIPGFHLEGPYISPLPGFRGAHLEKYIKIRTGKNFRSYKGRPTTV